MNEVKYLNIVTFDVPYPADYGGAIYISSGDCVIHEVCGYH